MRKFLTTLLVGGLLFGGVAVGAGTAEASIVTGRYNAQYMLYGAVPTPIAHGRIIGKTYYQDYYGVGPRNFTVLQLTSTKRGMVGSYARDALSKWYYRIEFRKTRYGYTGVVYSQGIPMGDLVLRKTR